MDIKSFFQIKGLDTAGAAARVYVPVVLLTRALALARLLVVGWLLGEAGKAEFGVYQPALECINWLTPLVMFGLGDVAERYASYYERKGQLGPFLRRQGGQLLAVGIGVAAVLATGSPVWGRWVFGHDVGAVYAAWLLAAVAVNVLLLSEYQWMLAALRGMRAYGAVAGMELSGAVALIVFSALGATQKSSLALLAAYAVANALPMAWYATRLHQHLHSAGQMTPLDTSFSGHHQLGRFGRWALLRVILMMSFGLVAIWSVGWLAGSGGGAVASERQRTTADFAMVYRIAQMLAYGAATFWASGYGIAARAWSHDQKQHAIRDLCRVGYLGGATLLIVGTIAVLMRNFVPAILPATYRLAVVALLPPLIGVFLWYGLLMFFTVLGDLQERPQIGALLWAVAVGGQIAVVAWAKYTGRSPADAQWIVAEASAIGVGVAVLAAAPLLLWRSLRAGKATLPMALLVVAGAAFFVPEPLFNWIVALAGAGAAVGLFLALAKSWGRRTEPPPQDQA